jgi:hypothetical protein
MFGRWKSLRFMTITLADFFFSATVLSVSQDTKQFLIWFTNELYYIYIYICFVIMID